MAATAVFQLCLIGGAPWGEYTQGGQNIGPLPRRNRVFAGVSIFVLAAMAAAVLSAAGAWPNWPTWTAWVVLATQALSTLLNWITPSVKERRLWGPITLVLLILALIVVFLGP
ncbi:hypothetical protein [Planktotalea sp.]|uniref:hypothetical protein n=1 Tax=Planktotalea sp. TaxID=2029877 RepID=UPI00329783BA